MNPFTRTVGAAVLAAGVSPGCFEYANSFQTYAVEQKGPTPIGYYDWNWLLHLDSKSKTFSINISGPTWTVGSDPAVWNKAPPSQS